MARLSCAMCNKFMEKGSRDHVFPEGLGSFSPTQICLAMCKSCNQSYGELEEQVLRKSFFTGIRTMLGIRSVKRKNSPFIDWPNEYRKSGNEDIVNVIIEKNGSVCHPVFTGDRISNVQLPPVVEIHSANGDVSQIDITGKDINDIASIIREEIKTKETQIYIKAEKEIIESTVKSLAEMRIITLSSIEMERGTGVKSLNTVKITGEINSHHIRAMAYMLLKALLTVGYDKGKLINLINYIKFNDLRNINIKINKYFRDASGIEMPQEYFSHRIEWKCDSNGIIGTVHLFRASHLVAGPTFYFKFPDKIKLFAPPFYPGKWIMEARYHPRFDGQKAGLGEVYTENSRGLKF